MKAINKFILCVALTLPTALFARENTGKRSVSSTQGALAEACGPTRSKAVLEINNVRTTIQAGGDMWWDLNNNPLYEIPKGSGKHSLFAGALWIGGLDDGNQLRLAAMTYRQTGNDFWAGPLDMNTVTTNKDRCDFYDKMDRYKITRQEVADYKEGISAGLKPTPSEAILAWPGNGDDLYNEDHYLAPYFDGNSNSIYDPLEGTDYPAYAFTEADASSRNQVYGDQTIWWVFNDKGNIHTETGAAPIGVEIQAQAFAFTTNDEINNMTFYSYKIINRSSNRIHDTYFGQWVDPDLGNYADDYVGCDVGRGLGYVYNGDNNDEGASGYGLNPPALGVDFFEGPGADPSDGVDNDRDCSIDEPGEQITMSKFVYYNNDYSLIGNPEIGPHFYNYLQGKFKDGTSMVYGKNGWQPSGGTSGIPCDFMFPGDSDPQGWGLGGDCSVKVASPAGFENWSEAQAQNTPADRRFLQSAGKFTLEPGAVNYITVGVVWGQASSGGAIASVNLIRSIDDKAQALFDNKFRLVDGPSAPTLVCQEMDKELLFYINNIPSSNNFKEKYSQIDPTIKTPIGQSSRYDSTYEFQGYMVYQLANASVGLSDILVNQNTDKAKLVFQCDIKDGVAELVNFTSDASLGGASVGRIMVKQAEGYAIDDGVKHSFRLTEDKFATGNSRLINHKNYYYMAIAYAYNNYKDYKQDVPSNGDPLTPASDGQKVPFLAGRLNVKSITVMPHIPVVENGGTIAKSYYGQEFPVTRLKGTGNGGVYLKLSDEEREKIINDTDTIINEVTYQSGGGPINVKVIDPLNVKSGDYTVQFLPDTNGTNLSLAKATWRLIDIAEQDTITSDRSIDVNYEQLIPELGISVSVNQVDMVGSVKPFVAKDFIGANVQFKDETKKWLSAVSDVDFCFPLNWIRSGIQGNSANSPAPCGDDAYADINGYDNDQIFENVLGGTWAPGFVVAGHNTFNYSESMPIANSSMAFSIMEPKRTQSVDVVITSDKTKWSRCPVFEMGSSSLLNENGGSQYQLRRHKSVDKEGNSNTSDVISTDPNDPNYISAYGYGWFPGYAVCVETGERLNIGFGEDSYLTGENGNDMKWNPTSNSFISPDNYRLGGKHFIYVFGSNAITNSNSTAIGAYDAGEAIFKNIGYTDNTYTTPGALSQFPKKLGTVYKAISWVNIPLLAEEHELFETDVTIELRVPKSFEAFPTATDWPEYKFNTSDLAAIKNSPSAAKAALALTNVVPNPYYGFSSYEGTSTLNGGINGQVDNRIRITYLPKKCTISIYTPNGNLIRRFTKDDDQTYMDWDLKNTAGIICASGVYLIHVEAPGIGEKVIKWFGVMRPLDLDTF